MKKDDYTNRELDSMFREIREYQQRSELLQEKILTQTTLTNGRVTNLEKWKESFIGKLVGAGVVIGFVWGIVWHYVTK